MTSRPLTRDSDQAGIICWRAEGLLSEQLVSQPEQQPEAIGSAFSRPMELFGVARLQPVEAGVAHNGQDPGLAVPAPENFLRT